LLLLLLLLLLLHCWCCCCRCSEPDYYKVIDDPVDLNTIEQNISSHRYRSISAFDEDFVHLFSSIEVGLISTSLEAHLMCVCAFCLVFVAAKNAKLCLSEKKFTKMACGNCLRPLCDYTRMALVC